MPHRRRCRPPHLRLLPAGEGLRNTIDLRGRSGTAHGNMHWSANFDEVGLRDRHRRPLRRQRSTLTAAIHHTTPPGTPNAGRSVALDALAAYVSSLGLETVARSPFRDDSGELLSRAIKRANVFAQLDCASCTTQTPNTPIPHLAPTLHDVGTVRTTSGSRLDGALTGIDTPTSWDSGKLHFTSTTDQQNP